MSKLIFWRSALVRELTLVLLIKLVLIYFLKVMFFSEPVAVSWKAPDIDQVLLDLKNTHFHTPVE
jgi:hypothetical protein